MHHLQHTELIAIVKMVGRLIHNNQLRLLHYRASNNSLPQLTARDVSERTEWLTREMFRAFTRTQTEIGILFSGSRQGLFINRVEAAMSKCISESDPSFDADVVRKIVLSFCVQGCYYTFTSYCGQMDEKRLVALLASIARAAQKIRM